MKKILGKKSLKKCHLCGAEVCQPKAHWRKVHQEEYPDFDDFMAAFYGIERPKCKWCGGETYFNGSHQQFECKDPECRSLGAKHGQITKMERGTCNSLKENRPVDLETGKDVLARKCADSARLNREDPTRKQRLADEKRARAEASCKEEEEWQRVHSTESQLWSVKNLVKRFGSETPAVFYCYLMSNVITKKFICKPGFSTHGGFRRWSYETMGYRVLEGFTISGTTEEMAVLEHEILSMTKGLKPEEVDKLQGPRNFITNGPTEHRIFDTYLNIKDYVEERGYNLEEVKPSDSKILEGIIKCSKFVSVNRRLDYSRGKKHLSAEYRREMEELEASLSRAKVPAGLLDPNSLYKVTLVFLLPQASFLRNDLDNLVKPVVDVISMHIGINDNRIAEYSLDKVPLEYEFPKDNPKSWLYFKIERLPLQRESLTITFDEFKRWAEFNGFKGSDRGSSSM